MIKLFSAADILMPKQISDMTSWSVIACDQFTSEREYWDNAESVVAGRPSTLRLMLPEIYLSESETRIPNINDTMRAYLESVLCERKDAMIYVRRTIPDGRVREGIVGKLDLEAYDFRQGTDAPVRATEATVIERIPPRVAIRRDAVIELPHVMMLYDDPADILCAKLREGLGGYECAYDFDLMLGAGHIEGYYLSDAEKEFVSSFIEEGRSNSLALCVGDGNHSLASAKALYEEIKAEIGEDTARVHPARYALCEIVNIHSSALDFEPIHRLIDDVDVASLLAFFDSRCSREDVHTLKYVTSEGEGVIRLERSAAGISVDPLQRLLDEYLSTHEGEIDYIHGDDSLKKLSKKKGCIGIYCEPITKDGLFSAVREGGSLPRKTFSMGVALEKRHYLEARKIR